MSSLHDLLTRVEKLAMGALERAEKATPGPWIPCVGSGYHLMTALHSDAKGGTFVCDFLPDYAIAGEVEGVEDDHRPNLRFVEGARTSEPLLAHFANLVVPVLRAADDVGFVEQHNTGLYDALDALVKGMEDSHVSNV
jgi:hypothetical protein